MILFFKFEDDSESLLSSREGGDNELLVWFFNFWFSFWANFSWLTASLVVTPYKKWKPKKIEYSSGTLWKYSQSVGPAFKGAVTHPGAYKEKKCYADI